MSDGYLPVVIKNNSDGIYRYDEKFIIEYKKDDTWYKLNMVSDLVFNDIGYVIKVNESNKINIDIKSKYGELSSGTYRLIKSFINSDDDKLNISVEFNINKNSLIGK